MRSFQRRFPQLRNLPDDEGYLVYLRATHAAKDTFRAKVLQLFNLLLVLIAGLLLFQAAAATQHSTCLTLAAAFVVWLCLCLLLSRAYDRLVIRPAIQAIAPHLCPACGYNLTGNTSGVCPECGREIGQESGGKVE